MPKSFDLLKIRAKSLKNWAPDAKKILCDLQKRASCFFVRVHERKFVMEALPQKNFSGKFGKVSAKILQTPRHLPAPALMLSMV